jgi:hypothetical protein
MLLLQVWYGIKINGILLIIGTASSTKVLMFFGNFVAENPENKLKAFPKITIIPIG